MKINKNLVSLLLAGAMTLSGCNKVEDKSTIERNLKTTFVTTAKKVIIEPSYCKDKILMDGIVVNRYAQGNGLQIPYAEESKKYCKGSPEYDTLRSLLTVEREY